MTFMAAEAGLLRPERNDLILFSNTSAEHPGTYEFVDECMTILEREYGLPCLWLEFCTVENASRGIYRRKASYRLVRRRPIEDDPDGYRSKGELFEEFVSLKGMLPNPHSRTCTSNLKLYPMHTLLSEWLGNTNGAARNGHDWGEILVDVDQAVRSYVDNGGSAPAEYMRQHGEYLNSLPPSREAQLWQDYTSAPVHRYASYNMPSLMRGQSHIQYVRLVGLRSDERSRVERIMSRAWTAEGASTAKCTVKNQPPGEYVYFPLHDEGFDKASVMEYCNNPNGHMPRLNIPEGAGNCTFCFMKGTRNLVALSKTADPRREIGTPSDLGWWADFEEKHHRTSNKMTDRPEGRFGFLGVNSVPLSHLLVQDTPEDDRYATGTPACDCTD